MRWMIKTVILTGLLHLLSSVLVFSQTILNSFPSPGLEPRGLAWDGAFLWCADYSSQMIFKLAPSTGARVDSFSFPLQNDFGGITWGDQDQIWVANGSYVYEVDPAFGIIRSFFHCPGG